jgi:hypothetical protein
LFFDSTAQNIVMAFVHSAFLSHHISDLSSKMDCLGVQGIQAAVQWLHGELRCAHGCKFCICLDYLDQRMPALPLLWKNSIQKGCCYENCFQSLCQCSLIQLVELHKLLVSFDTSSSRNQFQRIQVKFS